MASNKTTPVDYVYELEGQLYQLHQQLIAAQSALRSGTKQQRATYREYQSLIDRHYKIHECAESHQKLLYDAVQRGGGLPQGVDSLETKLKALVAEGCMIQLRLPAKFRAWSMAIKFENDAKGRVNAFYDKIERKEEEIHRLRPCVRYGCKHCRGGGDKPQPIDWMGTLKDLLRRKLKRE